MIHCDDMIVSAIVYIQEEQENYGIDWEGPVGIDVDTVEVPETATPIGCSLSEIESIVDPLATSDEFGVDLYLKLLDVISHS